MNWIREDIMNPYLEVCKRAVEDDEVFAVFKSLPAYRKILEHTSEAQGKIYYDLIRRGRFSLRLHDFLSNDICSPQKYFYRPYNVSPTTLQYVYVLDRLVNLFGPLDGMKIIEIGAGYGGQCKIIHDAFKPKSYSISDLKEVCRLQKKYLSKYAIDVLFYPEYYTVQSEYDLVISNYALSEVTEPLQTEFVKNVLLYSKHGYITCNGPIHAMQELKDKFPSFKISPDIEGERETNYIITW